MPDLSTFNSPGVYIRENTWGVIPASLVGHASVYILISVPNASTVARNTPIFIDSYDSFRNVFGTTSPSDLMVKAFFEQRSGVGINCVAVKTSPRLPVSLTTAAAASTVYSITINGVVYSHTSPATGFTANGIINALAVLINNTTSGSRLVSNTLIVPTGATTGSSATVTLGTPFVAPTVPDIHDVRLALATSFDSELPKGFIIAPEFYRAFTTASDLLQLQQALEAFAADPSFNWIALHDTSLAVGTNSSIPDFVRLVLAERASMVSPRGHSCLYAPYVVYDGVNIPPSSLVAATAVRVQREFGLRQPPASINYPLRGISGLAVNISRQAQEVLNPQGINCIRSFKNQGFCIYGARTLSTNKFYTFYLVRLVLNILAGTLEEAYEGLVLTSVDGLGTTFSNVVGTGKAVCEQLRRAGALYGQSPDQAYQVICNASNNPGIDLDAGKLSVDVIVVPTATIEVIGITLSRASIGSPLVETVTGVQSSATSSATTTVTPKS